VYLVVRNLFALVWLLGRPRRSKELEILVLRHELAILRRQAARPKLTRADRVLLAALSRSLPRTAWAGFSVKPETLLRWHRQLIARRWTYSHRAPGRPPLARSLRELIVRLARENPHWGYKRIVGEIKGLGIAVSATSVRKVLLEAGLQPAPQRTRSSWRAFLRAQAGSMLACDFLTVETIFVQRIYVLFFISLATRRVEYIGCTTSPDGRPASSSRFDSSSLQPPSRSRNPCRSATSMRTASCMHSTLAIDDRRLFSVYAVRVFASGRIGEGMVEGVDRIAWRDFDLTAGAGRQVADGKLHSVALGVPEARCPASKSPIWLVSG
jgi:transposase